MKTTLTWLLIMAAPALSYAKGKPAVSHAPAAHSFSHPAGGAMHSNMAAHNFNQHASTHTFNAAHSNTMMHGNNLNANGHANPLMHHGNFNAVNGHANPMLHNHANFANAHGNLALGAYGNRFAGNRFAANYRIHPYREVFHNYHAIYHDRYWYGSHYDRVVLFGGGYYYWDGGYWFPAWGYDPGYAYYAYDGPIYSYENLPPDQVIVNVQTELQDEGYYNGNLDGQLGPQTRQAVGAYQQDHNLEVTSAIDEPTVEALGLNS